MGEKMETVLGMIDVDLDGRFSKVRTQETNLGMYISLIAMLGSYFFLVNKIIGLHTGRHQHYCFWVANPAFYRLSAFQLKCPACLHILHRTYHASFCIILCV